MVKSKIIKLKKYLFLISILFFIVSLSNLLYIFLYNDSKMIPIKGGTVSEWLIWNFPSLNPLKPLKGNNKYMINLLYRSVLKYDSKNNKIDSDLASCDIEDLSNIECYLKNNIFWSNWEPITSEDIVATYNLLKNTWVNKIMSSLLEEVEIKQNEDIITFKSNKKDINILNIFFQPILSKNIINSLGNDTIFWDFPTHEQIYSWDFVISNISSDQTIWITKISLTRNDFNKKWNISKLIINLFPNTNSLLQNKDSVNIFNDNENIIWDSIPRLERYNYTLPQYVWLYINQNNIKNLSLRNHIFNNINTKNLINVLWKDKFQEIKNPYISDINIKKELTNKNFEKIIEWLWYIKKSKLIDNYIPDNNSVYSDEAKITDNKLSLTGNTSKISTWELDEITSNIPLNNLSIDKFQEDSKYIIEPTYVDKYNFITKDDILLQWNVSKDIAEIYVNDYKLSNYKKWSWKFYYRLKREYKNIKEWKNSYKIYFLEDWEKILKEEIYFLYYINKNKLDKNTTEFIKELYINEEKEILALKKEEEEKILTLKEKENQKEKTNIKENQKEKVYNEKLEKLNNIDEKFYYNEKLEKFSLNLYYISSEKDLEDTAIFIKNSLFEIWINIELFPITISNLRWLLSEKEKYDILLTWVNLWYFNHNIFPYFHSSQVKNWYNFSNVKKTSLDIHLEDLKSSMKSNEETEKIKLKIISILKKEQIVKTLYTPKINFLIDKNIKEISIDKKLINKSDRKSIYDNIYMKEEKIINFENKWILEFFNFILQKLNA